MHATSWGEWYTYTGRQTETTSKLIIGCIHVYVHIPLKPPNVLARVKVNVLSQNYIFGTTELNFGTRKKMLNRPGELTSTLSSGLMIGQEKIKLHISVACNAICQYS